MANRSQVGMRRPIRPTHGTLNNHDEVLNRLHDIVNGGINYGGMSGSAFSPGNTTIKGNTDSVHVKVTFSVTDTDVTVTHNLNRIPTGYKLVSANNPVQVYNGSVAPTDTQITLRGHLVSLAAVTVLEIY